jgi:hypothetical protein
MLGGPETKEKILCLPVLPVAYALIVSGSLMWDFKHPIIALILPGFVTLYT